MYQKGLTIKMQMKKKESIQIFTFDTYFTLLLLYPLIRKNRLAAGSL